MVEAICMGKRWEIKRLPLILPFLLLLLGSCATLPGRAFDVGSDDRRSVFDLLIGKSFDARSQPPTVSTQNARDLIKAGYATIGRLEVTQVVERCQPEGNSLSCQSISQSIPLREDYLREAARNGGDLILLEQDGQKKDEDFSIRGKCLDWGEVWRYMSFPVQKHRIGGSGRPTDYTTVYETRMVRFRECLRYENLAGKATTLTTSGTVWRKDAVLANAQRLNSEFIYAVMLDRPQQVKALLAMGLDVNTRNIDGELALGTAAVFARNEIITTLLDAGADVNAIDSFGTALHRAVSNGHYETAKLLIDRHANVSAKHTQARYPWKGVTPIFEASKNGNVELIRLLIKHGAKADETTAEGMTPLMMAAIKGHTEAIKTLIREGAKVSAVSKPVEWSGRLNEFSPLRLAILGNHLEAVMTLLPNGAKPTEMDKVFAFEELSEVLSIHERVSKVESAYGFIDTKGDFKLPPKWIHAESFSEGVAAVNVKGGQCGYNDKNWQFAIEPRFNYCKNFSEGLAAVMIPSKENGEKVLFGYIDKTGSIVIPPQFEDANEFSSGMATVCMKGVTCNKTRKVIDRRGRFLNPGEIPQQVKEKSFQTPDGSPLVNAFLTYDYPTRRTLSGYIDKDGKVIIAPRFLFASPFLGGWAAVNVPVEDIQNDISRWKEILASFALNREFKAAVLNGNVQSASSLVKKGVKIKEVDLHTAVYGGHPAMVRFLLDRGVNVNAQNQNGKTPLSITAEKNDSETAQILLQRGADPTIRDDMNLTPWEKAALLGNKEVLRILDKAEKAMK